MSLSGGIKGYIIAPVVTAAALSYAYPGSQQPFESIQKAKIKIEEAIPFEHGANQYYQLTQGINDIDHQINIMVNFVSDLLENTQDLDPKYSKLVDEHFWELL